MAFYNNKASIIELDKENLYLLQNNKKEIIMNHYNYKSNINKKETLCRDCNGIFDLCLIEQDIYLIYQDLLQNLNLITIDQNNKITNTPLTEEPIEKIYELNLFNNQESLNIIYLSLLSRGDKSFRIYHHYLEEDIWMEKIIEDIRAGEVLNPIKIIEVEEKQILCFYNKNNICIKELDKEDKSWGETIILNSEDSNKLYLDIIKSGDFLHLVYSLNQNDNYVIKYERYLYNEESIIKDREEVLSNESNCSNPTIIVYDDTIWVVWNESGRLYSRFSKDEGEIWSPLYYWKESISLDLIRYRYLSKNEDINMKLDYSFGTLSPEIKFLGFGPLEDVVETPIKKKDLPEIHPIIENHDKIENELYERLKEIDRRLKIIEEGFEKVGLIEGFLINNTKGHYLKTLKKPSE